ncbi:MAG TPA: hypothetical protein VHW60_13530 [Caulobacteraceae bacterium]|jgi:hypothetical protein|nr:hypothetical protein [Caulobacteraceae bacterium]
MHSELTESLYAMIVVSYATLATTTYIFTRLEAGALSAIKQINALRNGDCSFLWIVPPSMPIGIPVDGARTAEQKIRDEYDIIGTGSNSRVNRWQFVEISIFIAVLLPSVLLFPVLAINLGFADGHPRIVKIIGWMMLIGQAISSVSVPLVGLNLAVAGLKLKRIGNLLQIMKTVQVGHSALNPGPL